MQVFCYWRIGAQGPPKHLIFSLTLILSILKISSTRKNDSDAQNFLLRDLKLIERGEYSQQSKCPQGHYVVGIRQRTIKQLNALGETLTALELTCSDRISPTKEKFVHLLGKGGTWGEYLECPVGFAVGMVFKMVYTRLEIKEKKVGNVQLYCSSVSSADLMDSVFSSVTYEKKSGFSYNLAQFCTHDEGITELRTVANSEIEYYKGEQIRLKAVDIDCRKLDSPSLSCNFNFKWEKFRVENCSEVYKNDKINSTDFESQMNCSFYASVGVEYNKDFKNLINIIQSYHLHEEIVAYETRFTLMLRMLEAKNGQLPPTLEALISSFAKKALWKSNYLLKIKFKQQFHQPRFKGKSKPFINNSFVNLQHEEIIEQLVGICGIYVFRFEKFKSRHNVYFSTVINDFPTKVAFVT